MSAPIRRDKFKLDSFAAYLASNGAEICVPTNQYEVIRYRAFWEGKSKPVVHIVYVKESGLLTYTGGSKEHYEAFLHGDDMPDTKSEAVEEKRVRRVKNTTAIREKLRQRDGDACWYCGCSLDAAPHNVEHLINISDGGTNALSNLVLAHVDCNAKAGNLPLHKKMELRAQLLAGVLS